MTKNGDTMAFITLDDKFGEIEIIVFAKLYKQFSSEIFEDNAVVIEGRASAEDGEDARILLESLKSLKTNSEYKEIQKTPTPKQQKRIYIKVPNMSDPRINTVIRTATLNPGRVPIVFYDASTGKYQAMKNLTVNDSDKVIERLQTVFGRENIK